jgi:hypothetical protein
MRSPLASPMHLLSPFDTQPAGFSTTLSVNPSRSAAASRPEPNRVGRASVGDDHFYFAREILASGSLASCST